MAYTRPSLQKNIEDALTSRRAWRFISIFVESREAFGASRSEATSSADLGGSSKYSNENFED